MHRTNKDVKGVVLFEWDDFNKTEDIYWGKIIVYYIFL